MKSFTSKIVSFEISFVMEADRLNFNVELAKMCKFKSQFNFAKSSVYAEN